MSAARRRKRQRAVEELLSTEKTYVHLLSKLMEHFVQKLRFNTSLLSNDDYKVLFPSDLHAILGLNRTFLQDLKTVIEGGKFNNDNTKIGNIIYAFCPHFKMYQNYLNNYSAAAERLAQLRKKSTSSFSIYCDRQREKKYFNNLPLESLIILPIQRMPRYKMLLEEIIKHTQSNHPDLQQLKQALAKISEVNDSINNRMNDFDARIKVQNIENRFTSKITLVTPSRRYIKHGQLCKIESKDDQDYLFMLFNDCLLFASQTMIGDKLILGNILYFNSKFKIQKTSNRTNVHLIEHLFEIHSTTESFMLYASTKKEMNDWVQIISDTYNAYTAHRQHLKTADSTHRFAATLFIPNDFADKCMVNGCNSKFSFVNRRHHCKYCGYVVCGKCSSNQLRARPTDAQQTSEMVRVCDACYKQHAGTVTLPTKVRHHSTEKALQLLGYSINEKQKIKSDKMREDELLKLYTKRAKEAEAEEIDDDDDEETDGIAPLSMNDAPKDKVAEQKKKRNSAVLDFVKLDIKPKLMELETQNKELTDKVSSLKHKNDEFKLKVISLERVMKDQKYAEKQTVSRLERQNKELRADHERLQSLVTTLSTTTDKSKRAEEIQNTKIKTLEAHNKNLQNEFLAKEDEIKELLQKQSELQDSLQQKEQIIQQNKQQIMQQNKQILEQNEQVLSGINQLLERDSADSQEDDGNEEDHLSDIETLETNQNTSIKRDVKAEDDHDVKAVQETRKDVNDDHEEAVKVEQETNEPSHAPRNDDGTTIFTAAINTNMLDIENTVSQNVVGENESDEEKKERHTVPVTPPPNPFEIKQRSDQKHVVQESKEPQAATKDVKDDDDHKEVVKVEQETNKPPVVTKDDNDHKQDAKVVQETNEVNEPPAATNDVNDNYKKVAHETDEPSATIKDINDDHKDAVIKVIQEKNGGRTVMKKNVNDDHKEGVKVAKETSEPSAAIKADDRNKVPHPSNEPVAHKEDKTYNAEPANVPQNEAKRICSACNKEIVRRALRTKGGLYHRKCHICNECKSTLAGKLYGTLERNGKKIKLCEECTNKANEKMIEDFTKLVKKKRARSKSNLFRQMNKYRNSGTKVPKLWNAEKSSSPTLKPSLAASISNDKNPTLKKTKSNDEMFKAKRANLKKVQKKKNSRASTLIAQRTCSKCKSAVFGKNSISGPNNSMYHPNCFQCNDCCKELQPNKWRNYPIVGKKGTSLTLCPNCARKRDEALFSTHRGKLKLNI